MHLAEEVTSTQDVAASLFVGRPILVVAQRQTAGRGRSGNVWATAPRALAASLAVPASWPEEAWSLVPLVAGVAAARSIGGKCKLKWPNDLMIEEVKVGGLLAEASPDRFVIGCGINLYWPQPPEGVGSIYQQDPGAPAVEAIARAWADELSSRLALGPSGWDSDDYRRLSDTLGRSVSWEPEGQGRAIDIADDGSLIVRQQDHLVRLSAGQIRHLRSG
ncbi:MAG TPA: biotin--[acetyl-CoA-carboxylase] ligase [Acidimicrobiia bacterium]|nr:biotin--[acetyl-CoA-carboxylase] ligase [Acidimicrobiia bacterium]